MARVPKFEPKKIRDYLEEASMIKAEPEIKVLEAEGSPQTCNDQRSSDHLCLRRRAGVRKLQKNQDIDLEEKPLPPSQILSRISVDHVLQRNKLDIF